jgi:uncharacterized protein YciI
MLFAITCLDKPNSLDLRLANRAAHLDYAQGWRDKILLAGPLLADDGQTMIGSHFIVEAQDRAEIDRFLAGDPYGKAGLFQNVEAHPFRKVLP